jgi:hypothetical protein
VTSPLRRWFLAAVVVAAVAAGAFVATRALGTDDTTASSGSAASTTAPPPGTVAGVDAARTATAPVETDPPDEVATDAPHTPEQGRADVVVSYAGWDAASSSVEVDGFVGSRIEEGGTCTVTLTRDGATRTASAPAFADASTTICHPLLLPGRDLGPGRWQAVLGYSSAQSAGTSATVEVDVP